MRLHFIEATNGPGNWGKFAVGRPAPEEWEHRSVIDEGAPLLSRIGWSPEHLWVFDFQTGEAGFFRPGGVVSADLSAHRIWVCPLFEPFLTWLYEQDLTDLGALPAHVDLPRAPFALSGHRRAGTASSWDPRWSMRPGDLLREALEERNLTQAAFAKQIGRPAVTISEIIANKRGITTQTALDFERVLDIRADFWVGLQAQYALHQARKRREVSRDAS